MKDPNILKAVSDDEKPLVKRSKDGSLVFEFPETIKRLLDEKLGFNYSKFEIEAEPTVADLVRHISEQASIECFFNTQCAYTKNQLEVCKEVYSSWYNRTCYRHRIQLITEHKSKFSEKLLENHIHTNYQSNIYHHRAKIIKLETKYRDLCGVRDAFINKGKYLQTLKGLIEIDHQPIKQNKLGVS